MLHLLRNIYYSFPVQLLVLHLRNNHLLIGMWIILFLLVSGNIGAKFGIYYLFLDAEYLGKINFLSFFLLGLAFGCFFLTWNLTTYLLSSHHFPFLATLFHPFTKFCLNNAVIPLSFFIFYLANIFQLDNTHRDTGTILLYCLGFTLGAISLGVIYFLYFNFTNRDISYYMKAPNQPPDTVKAIKPGRRDVDLNFIKQDKTRWKVKTFLNESLQIRLVRSVAHYDSKLLMGIFKQNHLNALILQLITIILLMFLGLLTDYPSFRLPAGASIFFLLSIITAIIGALTYWLNRWLVTSLIVIILSINFITSHKIGYHNNYAYGMRYDTSTASYSLDRLKELTSPSVVQDDINATTDILNNWKKKVQKDSTEKPKMVLISTSGGGLTSATWVLQSIQKADSLLGGKLLDHTVLMTGASGGILGVAYLRELMLREAQGEEVDIYDPVHVANISKDLLNSITFTLVANDLSIPWTRFDYEGKSYFKDRGYIFEKQFNENTFGILDKPLMDYRAPVKEGTIPLLYITPSILNDGRKLYISSQGTSFMMVPPVGVGNPNLVEIDAVDYQKMFAEQGADSLRFLTALRMSATFPYILPNVQLPSTPAIEVMDAGFLDNYGLHSAIRFMQVFRSWIQENTSGIVLLQICTSSKIEEIGAADTKGIITSLFGPVEMAGQIFTRQEFEQDNNLGFIYDLFGSDAFHHVRFNYVIDEADDKNKAIISFHITEREREKIRSTISAPANRSSLQQLKLLLD